MPTAGNGFGHPWKKMLTDGVMTLALRRWEGNGGGGRITK